MELKPKVLLELQLVAVKHANICHIREAVISYCMTCEKRAGLAKPLSTAALYFDQECF